MTDPTQASKPYNRDEWKAIHAGVKLLSHSTAAHPLLVHDLSRDALQYRLLVDRMEIVTGDILQQFAQATPPARIASQPFTYDEWEIMYDGLNLLLHLSRTHHLLTINPRPRASHYRALLDRLRTEAGDTMETVGAAPQQAQTPG